MEGLTLWLSQPANMLWCIIALLILFFAPLYILFALQRRQTRNRLRDMEDLLAQSLRAFREKNAMERGADREEMSRGLRGMSDSVVRMMGELGRTQQQQLDSFGGQIRAMNRTDEERMERLHAGMGERFQEYDRRIERMTQGIEEKLDVHERRLSEMRNVVQESAQRTQGELDKKLELIRETVDEKLNATLDKRLGESFRTVSERLEQVHKGLGEMQNLASGVGDLKKVLTSVKTRGIWGEVQLGALLEQVLTPPQYDKNVAVKPGGTERVEFAIRLPGKDAASEALLLPIDSKFPAEDYQRLLDAGEAGDKDGAEAAGKALEATIRAEAKRIRTKYIKPPHTTDFAIMFLPVEGLFAEVLKRGGIVEQLQNDYRVVITGPTTLLALLNSLQMGFRTIAIEQRSSEVWELLGAVKSDFGRFASLLNKTQQRLSQATASIEDAARKSRTIQRRLQNVQELSTQDTRRVLEPADTPPSAETEYADEDDGNENDSPEEGEE